MSCSKFKFYQKKSNERMFILFVFLVALLLVGIGYAYLNSNLNINGTTGIANATWDIHWKSTSVSPGSVSGASVTQAPTISGTANDTITYIISLTNPGDYYEFTAVAENLGSIDGMISSVVNGIYQANGTTPRTLPDYLNYEVTYSDGLPVVQKQILESGETETFKVRVEFRSDITSDQLPENAETIVFSFGINYAQADSTAKAAHPTSFSTDDWATVVRAIQLGLTSSYHVGDTKTVDMGSLGTHTLRIANTSTPAACATEGFSQTACGFVLEFADVVANHNMNPAGEYQNTYYDYGWNIGGWPASSMRSYVNTDIYNALPSVIKNGIIDTKVISGHGSDDPSNFESTDKLYLLDSREVYGTSFTDSFNTANDYERQLDYYDGQSTTTSNYSAAVKQSSDAGVAWWLRSANSSHYYYFYSVTGSGSPTYVDAYSNIGVSPAFRIG